jgi:hypothetical protein
VEPNLTEDTTLTIVDAKFCLEHPELHHYTTYAGLKGIFESNTLWATHFADLNDTAELTILREPLISAVAARLSKLLSERQRNFSAPVTEFDMRLGQTLARPGGADTVAYAASSDLVSTLYGMTFKDMAAFPFAEPFIASFCSHAADQVYEKDNGLLSQWRGYGRDGGYCLVFDTAGLSDLLGKEFDAHYWIYMRMASVHYAVDGVSVEKLFPDLLDRCAVFLSGIIDGAMGPIPDDGFAPFVRGATLLKHQGFREEREVRIVAAPGSERVLERVRAEHQAFIPAPIKIVQMRGADGGTRRYLSLFDSLKVRLPIKRIIVGPSRRQSENYTRASELLGGKLPLRLSDTPFIE